MTSPYERCLWGKVRTVTIWWSVLYIMLALLILLSTFYVHTRDPDQLPNKDSSRDFKEKLLNLVTGSLAIYGALKRRPNFVLPLLMFSMFDIFSSSLVMVIRAFNETKAELGRIILQGLLGVPMDVCIIYITYKCFKHLKYEKHYVV
uniref:Lysosomal amino acid transporter 1 homolog n=1 Tax=Steinernema glaseri TaxID=37863 RepID=A0A1I7Y153_9BILA